jgi:hypothetical protein
MYNLISPVRNLVCISNCLFILSSFNFVNFGSYNLDEGYCALVYRDFFFFFFIFYSSCFLFVSLCFRYDPSTGIYGMDFYVVLERPGYRVGRRRRCKARVGIQHRVTKEDAMKWFQVKYEGVILNKSQNIS